jgi:hypothetical protein
MAETNFVSLVSEIFKGYTELSFAGNSVFLKHINFQDQDYLDSLIKKRTAHFAHRVPTEKERLEELRREKLWTDKDELDIGEKEYEIKNLYQTKKKILIHSQKKGVQDLIDKLEIEIAELKNKKSELVGQTAEYFASRQANEEFLRHLLFKDETLTAPAFSQKEFDEISREELTQLFIAYKETIEKFGDEKIQEAVLQDFFSMYMPFCERPVEFYGKPVISLSIFQQKLLIWGKTFFNIFQNVEKIPEEIRKKPKDLLDFADSSRNKEKMTRGKKGEGETSFVMGTREDAEILAGDGAVVGDLTEELKKSGGFLSQSQLLAKMGIQSV